MVDEPDSPIDEGFVESLASFDELLAGAPGHGPAPSASPPPAPSPELLDDLDGAKDCLLILETVWPRKDDAPSTWSDLGTSPAPPTPGTAFPTVTAPVPRRLGRFLVSRRLGGGGGGVVFLAHDPVLARPVALKLPRPEALLTDDLRERFLREAQIAAQLDHPNLVPVYDAGQFGPVCYIASAYCEGRTLSAWLRETDRLDRPHEAAALVAALADAVQHAHDHGILHRDIKPSNILLILRRGWAGKPDRLEAFLPKLTDFGLARAEYLPDQTRSGVIVGTPLYMAPEQARGRSSELGPHTDVYALGVVLYELLVGKPPFQGESELDILGHVLTLNPVAPRSFRPEVPRDLEAVCLHCLEKPGSRRYATARELADDLRRFLVGKPTRARPLGVVRKGWRWARNNPVPAALTAAVALLVVGTWSISVDYSARMHRINGQLLRSLDREQRLTEQSQQQKREAQEQETLNHRYLIGNVLPTSWRELQSGSPCRAQAMLRDVMPQTGQTEARGFAWHYLWKLCRNEVRLFWGHDAPVYAVAFSPDGHTLATGTLSGEVILWDPDGIEPRARLAGHTLRVDVLAFSADGRDLAVSGGEWGEHGELSLWDVRSSSRTARFGDGLGPVDTAFFAAGGTRLVAREVRADGTHRLLAWSLPAAGDRPAPAWVIGNVEGVAVSPDGRRLAVAEASGRLSLRDPADGHVIRKLRARAAPTIRFAFAPDGSWLAGARAPHDLTVWDVATGRQTASYDDADAFAALAVAPDGRTIASVSSDRRLTLREMPSGRVRVVLPGCVARPGAVVFTPDGRGVAVAREDLCVTLLDTRTGNEVANGWRAREGPHALAASPDGRFVALASEDHDVRVWPLRKDEGPRPPRGHDIEAWCLAFAPDGATLASGSDDHLIKLWSVADGSLRASANDHGATVTALTFAPDGETLAAAGLDHTVTLHDRTSGKLLRTLSGHTDAVRALAYPPDGTLLATAGSDLSIRLWDPATGRPLRVLGGHTNVIRALAFTPEGRTLASAANDQTVRYWLADTGEPGRVEKEGSQVWCLAFTRDGRTVAAGTRSGTVTLRDVETRTLRHSLKGHAGAVAALAFSPDGLTLATGGEDHTVRLWDVVTGQELLVLSGHGAKVNAVAFAPNGRLLASASHDGAIRFWAADPPGR